MNKPEHVDVNVALRLSEEIPDRIRYIQEDQWFETPDAMRLLDQLKLLMMHPPKVRPKCMLVLSKPGMGKTAIIHRFCEQHSAASVGKRNKSTTPVVRIEMPEPADRRTLLEAFLDALDAPRPDLPYRQLQSYLIRQYSNHQVQLALVDEAQRIALVGNDAAKHCCELLRWLSNVTRRPVVVFANPEVLPHFQQYPQLSSRFKPIELPTWTLNNDFQSLVKTQLLHLPLREPWDPNILKREGLEVILERSGRTTDGVLSLLKDAATDVLSDGRECLTLDDIKAVQ